MSAHFPALMPQPPCALPSDRAPRMSDAELAEHHVELALRADDDALDACHAVTDEDCVRRVIADIAREFLFERAAECALQLDVGDRRWASVANVIASAGVPTYALSATRAMGAGSVADAVDCLSDGGGFARECWLADVREAIERGRVDERPEALPPPATVPAGPWDGLLDAWQERTAPDGLDALRGPAAEVATVPAGRRS